MSKAVWCPDGVLCTPDELECNCDWGGLFVGNLCIHCIVANCVSKLYYALHCTACLDDHSHCWKLALTLRPQRSCEVLWSRKPNIIAHAHTHQCVVYIQTQTQENLQRLWYSKIVLRAVLSMRMKAAGKHSVLVNKRQWWHSLKTLVFSSLSKFHSSQCHMVHTSCAPLSRSAKHYSVSTQSWKGKDTPFVAKFFCT